MDPLAIVLAVVAAFAGAALGWLAGSRPVADWRARHAEREAETRDATERLSRMTAELATMSERAQRADGLAEALDAARTENVALKTQAAGFDEQKRLLMETREQLLKEFQNTGSAVLSRAQEAFLERANERFGHAERASEEKLRALLQPVGDKLKSYETQVAELEARRVDAFGQLTGLIHSMREGQEAVRTAAQQLGNSLRNAPKARGRWGEQQLRNVLEQCGLAEHTDFVIEQSIDTDEGRLRPDAIVRVPGNKLLVIDAKVSLNAYQEAFEATEEAERARHLDAHSASMRTHIQALGAKSYQSQFEDAPDYVLMFVPGEHFIAAALEHDPRLWDFAFERRVLLASPTNLVAIARTIAQVWRQDGLAKEAREIGRMGGELYDRLAKVTQDIAKVGTHLGRAVGSYNDFARSFESRVLVSAKRLRDKHIEIGKREIEDVPIVESAPRYGAADEPATPRLVDTAIADDARGAG